MEVSTQNSTDQSLEKVSVGKPISVYTANFSKVIAKFPRKKLALKRKTPAVKPAAQESFSSKVFSWRNASAAAAILAIGVLHFAFQVSFIRSEVTENRPPAEVPAVTVEQPVSAVPVEAEETADAPTKNKIESKIDASAPRTARLMRQRQAETPAPVKAQPRKREAVESRAARLRRVERILTGV